MSDVAVYASTLALAVQLGQASHRTHEATQQAASVATTALDLASAEARNVLEAELRAAGQLGDGADQFPASPWVLWEDQRIFRLLKSADLDERTANALRGLTIQRLMEMSPASILAMLGAPHRPIWLPRWALAAAVGLAVGTTVAVFLRDRRASGEPWPA